MNNKQITWVLIILCLVSFFSCRKKLTKKSADQYWEIGKDTYIYHFEQGIGEPVLVLHGGPAIPQSEAWTGLKPLTADFRFIYYHQRGCGKSTRKFDKFDPDTPFYMNMIRLVEELGLGVHVRDIEKIRQILEVDKISIIGHAFGSFLAAMYASEYPEYTKKLVLISPTDIFKHPSDNPGLFDLIKAKFHDPDLKNSYDLWYEKYFDYENYFIKDEKEVASLHIEYSRFFQKALAKMDRRISVWEEDEIGGWVVPAIYLGLGKKYDLRELLEYIEAPALLIRGKHDLFPVEHCRDYLDNINNIRLETINEGGHFVFALENEDFAMIIRDFLK